MAQIMPSSTATSPTTGVLGPLVTIFTPPAWCTLNVAECEDTCTVAWRVSPRPRRLEDAMRCDSQRLHTHDP